MPEQDKHRKLKNYLSSHHKEYNQYLLNPVRIEDDYEQIVLEIEQSLDEAESHDNSVVHHCGDIDGLPVEVISIWFKNRIGKVVKFPNFLSTTRDADYFFKGQSKVFKIITKDNSSGKDVSSLGFPLPIEGEITFKKDSIFEITEVNPDLITLTEIMEAPDDVFTLKIILRKKKQSRNILIKEMYITRVSKVLLTNNRI